MTATIGRTLTKDSRSFKRKAERKNVLFAAFASILNFYSLCFRFCYSAFLSMRYPEELLEAGFKPESVSSYITLFEEMAKAQDPVAYAIESLEGYIDNGGHFFVMSDSEFAVLFALGDSDLESGLV